MNNWNLTEDRMPKKSGSYLITTAKGAVCVAHYYDGKGFSSGAGKNAVAWMELPKPYGTVKKKVELCSVCAEAAEYWGVNLRKIGRGKDEKVYCNMCGRKRYGGMFEM